MEDLHRALESNNLTVGWTPKHRVGFYHSTYDTVVPFVNLCSFVKNQNGLTYYFSDVSSGARMAAGGAYPSHVTADRTKADVFINVSNSKHDHIDAGSDFFILGKVFGTSPDYALYKWVIEKKK
jgi:hypothetical protein